MAELYISHAFLSWECRIWWIMMNERQHIYIATLWYIYIGIAYPLKERKEKCFFWLSLSPIKTTALFDNSPRSVLLLLLFFLFGFLLLLLSAVRLLFSIWIFPSHCLSPASSRAADNRSNYNTLSKSRSIRSSTLHSFFFSFRFFLSHISRRAYITSSSPSP